MPLPQTTQCALGGYGLTRARKGESNACLANKHEKKAQGWRATLQPGKPQESAADITRCLP